MMLGFLTFGGALFAQETKLPVFKSEAEKSEWIQNHPEEYSKLSGQQTSNEVPEFATQEEKNAWLESQEAKRNAESNAAEQELKIARAKAAGLPITEIQNEAQVTPEMQAKELEEKKASLKARGISISTENN
jgi:hypothetical protein